MRTLVVTKNLPWPANSGEKQRTLGVVRALAALGPVTVVGYAGDHDDPAFAAADGVSVCWVPLAPPAPPRWAAQLLRQRSVTAGRWWHPALAAAAAHEIDRGVEVVVVEHVQLAGVVPQLPDGVLSVLDMHNVESVLTRRLGQTSRSWRRWVYLAEAAALERLERRTACRFDVVSLVSTVDRDLLAAIVPHDRTAVVPNAIDADPALVLPIPTTGRPTACFVGLMGWAPNAEAAVAFTRRVWPLVRRRVPDARLLLVGREPSADVLALAEADDVVVTGTVADLTPYYAQSLLALAPLLAGGGSRLKILEALARGRPVVATPVGAEGLEDLVGRGVLTAGHPLDDPQTMADLVADLLLDPALCAELGARGAAAVRAEHSWSAATAPLVAELRALCADDRVASR